MEGGEEGDDKGGDEGDREECPETWADNATGMGVGVGMGMGVGVGVGVCVGVGEGGGTRYKRTSMVAPRSEYLAALLTRQRRFSVRNCRSVMMR